MLKKHIWLLSVPIIFSACNNETCNPSGNSLSEGGGLSFQLVDIYTGQNLLAQMPGNGSFYSSDSVMVYNEKGEPQFKGPVDFRGEVSFSTYGSIGELNTLPYNTDIQRRFTLYLSKYDQDTIDVSFILHKNDCGFSEFANIKIYYNTQLEYEGDRITEIPARVFRKK